MIQTVLSLFVGIWTLSTLLLSLCCAQPTLTGPSEAVCPGDPLTFSCVAEGVQSSQLLRWTAENNGETLLNSGSFISAYEGGVVLIPASGFTATASLTSGGVLTALLKANATADLNGARVLCSLVQTVSNIVDISVRTGSAVILFLRASAGSTDPVMTTLSWSSSPPADNYTITVTPPPPTVMSTTDTTLVITLSYNTPYTLSVSGTVCGLVGDPLTISYTIVQCDNPGVPGNGTVGTVTERGEGAMITFQCNGGFSPLGAMTSNCTSNGTWSPDPGSLQCSPVTCPPLIMPVNGSGNFSTQPSPVNSTVLFQCNPGLFPDDERIATCLESGEWDSDLSQLVCRARPVNCSSAPSEPVNGMIVNLDNVNTTENSVITFMCDPGFSLVGEGTATCNNSGLWDPNPALLDCQYISTSPPTSGGNAAVAGGAAGGVVIVVVVVPLIVIIAIYTAKRKGSVKLKSSENIEMDEKFDGQYSDLHHGGPKKSSKKIPPADEEGYNRITHDLNPQNPTSLTYDEVVIGDKKPEVNADGYSVMNNGQGTQRLPGYGQLGNVATIVYAPLSIAGSQTKTSDGSAIVDQNQVTYAIVDAKATRKLAAQKPKAATLPTNSPLPGSVDLDKLLDLDQAMIQIRSVKHRWRELAEALRLPETLIEQIGDHYSGDEAGCLTEVIDQWIKGLSGPPAWRELADNLNKIGEKELADQLMSIYQTGRLPVELNMKEVPKDVYKYSNAPPPPIPSRSPTINDSPAKSKTLPPSRPPKPSGDSTPARPPKPVPRDESPAPPRPPKHYARH